VLPHIDVQVTRKKKKKKGQNVIGTEDTLWGEGERIPVCYNIWVKRFADKRAVLEEKVKGGNGQEYWDGRGGSSIINCPGR